MCRPMTYAVYIIYISGTYIHTYIDWKTERGGDAKNEGRRDVGFPPYPAKRYSFQQVKKSKLDALYALGTFSSLLVIPLHGENLSFPLEKGK